MARIALAPTLGWGQALCSAFMASALGLTLFFVSFVPTSIHPSHRPDLRLAAITVGVSFSVLLLALWLLPMLAVGEKPFYLPMHMGLETLAISACMLIFALAWTTRHQQLPFTMWVLGLGFSAVAILDFSHGLSPPGMPHYVTDNTTDKALHFWFSARLLDAGLLLAVAWLPWQGVLPAKGRTRLALGLLLYVVLMHALIFWAPGSLPSMFDPEQGLTRWKVGTEYLLIALYTLAAVTFLIRLRQPRQYNASALFAASCLLAQAGILFTLYANAADSYNALGHVYKVLAYAFLYYAVFVETVRQPYAMLEQSRQQLDATLTALPDLLFEIDEHGYYRQVHTPRCEELSVPVDMLLGRSVYDILPHDSAVTMMQALQEAKEHGTSHGKIIHLPVRGVNKLFEQSIARLPAQHNRPQHFLVISRDITERQRTAQTLSQLSQAVAQSPLSIVITDRQARIEYVNEAFTHITGYSAAEVLGQNSSILQSGKTPQTTYHAMWHQLSQGKSWQGELINLRKDGEEITESMLVYPLRNDQGEITHYLAHKENITEKKKAAERLQQLTHYDQLTSLPNRSLLGEQFDYARKQNQRVALLWIDLDHFKDINDALGHNIGDLLLLQVAQRLRRALRPQDTLARISGDDFVAMLPDTQQDGAAQQAQALLHELATPIRLAAQEVLVSASIGIALCPDDGLDIHVLQQNAEAAMYRTKEEGRNNYGFYAPAMQERAARTLALSTGLKQALARHELQLVYQPQVCLHTGRVKGLEALLRWHSPQWGHVSPGEFIPLAEANGHILPIGEWVLRTALLQLRQWLDQGLPPLTVAINLSAQQFGQSDLPQLVQRLLQETNVPAQYLELELTEAVAMKNPEAGALCMQELVRMGVALSIDDFGTGYSSLSYLKRFHIHTLKIDQSFVRDLCSNTEDQAIVRAIVQMAHSLDMHTIAEGVETQQQLHFLQAQGCDQVQGYFFSRPLPPEAVADFVHNHPGLPCSCAPEQPQR